MRWAAAIAAGLLAAAAAYYFKLPLKLGAHPFWADQVIIRGAPVGIILAILISPLRYTIRTIGLSSLAIVAFIVAHTGKIRFAASYGDDTLAGQMWFFGWHAVIIFGVAAVTSLVLAKGSRGSRS